MTAPLDFSTVTNALPAFAFGLASRIGYEAFGVLHADMAGKPLDLDRVRELLGEKQAAIVKRWAGRRRDVVFPACHRAVLALRNAEIRKEVTNGMGKKASQRHMALIRRIADAHGVSADYIARVAHGKKGM